MLFQNKTVIITGASRGIGKAIGLRLAKEGANIVIASKSVEENPKLGGTIYSAAEEMIAAGGKALAIPCDIRDEIQIQHVVDQTIAHFGAIDILVNNASAISLTATEQTEAKRYDLMYNINVRGTFFMCKNCIPHLKKSTHAHILTLSPPLNMDMKWFKNHLAYTISKYNMSMIALGLAAELAPHKIGVNALWPCTTIATAAIRNLLGGEALINKSRTPDIVADAAYAILSKLPTQCTGNTFTDEQVLLQDGISDFSSYAVSPGAKLVQDFFL